MLDVISKSRKDSPGKADNSEVKPKEASVSPKKGKRKRSLSDTQMDTDSPVSNGARGRLQRLPQFFNFYYCYCVFYIHIKILQYVLQSTIVS